MELDKNIDETLVMLGQSFNQVVQQAYLLYGDLLPSGRFDADMDVYKGRMSPSEEAVVTATEGAGGEDL